MEYRRKDDRAGPILRTDLKTVGCTFANRISHLSSECGPWQGVVNTSLHLTFHKRTTSLTTWATNSFSIMSVIGQVTWLFRCIPYFSCKFITHSVPFKPLILQFIIVKIVEAKLIQFVATKGNSNNLWNCWQFRKLQTCDPLQARIMSSLHSISCRIVSNTSGVTEAIKSRVPCRYVAKSGKWVAYTRSREVISGERGGQEKCSHESFSNA
jgi:hypothetical protein